MGRIYLCGPITNIPNYRLNFRQAEDLLVEKGYRSIVNPAELCNVLPEDYDYEEIMEICFDMLQTCEVLCLLPGWEKSIGCNREYGFATASDKIIITLDGLTKGD